MNNKITILERDEYSEKYVDENGEIHIRALVNPEEKDIVDKKERKRRRDYYLHLEIEAEKSEKAKRLENDTRGDFFMQNLGKNAVRKKEELTPRIKGLSLTEEGYFLGLLTYFFDSSNKPLQVLINGKKEIMKNKHVESVFKISKGRVSQILKTFRTVGILQKREGQKGYFVNSKYFKMKTSAKGEYVTRVYQEKLKEIMKEIEKLLNDVNEQMACLGLLGRLGYMVHHQTYDICSNPDDNICEPGETVKQAIERNPDAINYYGKREFLHVLSTKGKELNKETLDFNLKVLISAGAITQTIGVGVIYQMHPDLMNRQFSDGLDEYADDLRLLFKKTKAAGKQQLTAAKRRRNEIKKKTKIHKAKSVKKREEKTEG